MFAHALRKALYGDYLPARRLVESYRRVFGAMAAVELKRILWQSIAEAEAHVSAHASAGPLRHANHAN